MADSSSRELLNPDEAASSAQVRRSLDILVVGAGVSGGAECAWALVEGKASFLFAALVIWSAGAWIFGFERRSVGRTESTVLITRVTVIVTGALVVIAVLQPFLALEVVAAMLLPILLAMPYLDGQRLLRLTFLVVAAALAAGAASFLPEETAANADGLQEVIH